MTFWLGQPPKDEHQNLMNCLKCISALLTGVLKPTVFQEACESKDVGAITAFLRQMIEKDGAIFAGTVCENGVELETHPILGPENKATPEKDPHTPQLTVTTGDQFMQVQFLNFQKVIDSRAVYSGIRWGPTFALIVSYYDVADILLMVKGTGHLPKDAGSAATKKAIEWIAYKQYWLKTGGENGGLDLYTNQPPKRDWLEWVKKYEYN